MSRRHLSKISARVAESDARHPNGGTNEPISGSRGVGRSTRNRQKSPRKPGYFQALARQLTSQAGRDMCSRPRFERALASLDVEPARSGYEALRGKVLRIARSQPGNGWSRRFECGTMLATFFLDVLSSTERKATPPRIRAATSRCISKLSARAQGDFHVCCDWCDELRVDVGDPRCG